MRAIPQSALQRAYVESVMNRETPEELNRLLIAATNEALAQRRLQQEREREERRAG